MIRRGALPLLCALVGCEQRDAPQRMSGGQAPVSAEGKNWVMFSTAETSSWMKKACGPAPNFAPGGRAIVPRRKNVHQAESALVTGAHGVSLPLNLVEYRRQYFAIEGEGRALLYVMGTRKDLVGADWFRKPIVMCGGGTGRWAVWFDPQSKEFFEFQTNL